MNQYDYFNSEFYTGKISVRDIVDFLKNQISPEQEISSDELLQKIQYNDISEKEISNKHIFKNAMVPLVSSIPASIVGVISGATLTETVFAFPGMGKMLIDSVKASNNSMVVGLVFIFTCLSIFALLLGDILMTVLDPRIKLTSKGGK